MARPDSALVQAWRLGCDVTRRLLEALPPKALEDRYAERTRTVASQFAHIHNVRVYQLKKRGSRFLGDLETFPRGAQPTRAQLKTALAASEKAVAHLLSACEETGRVPSWKGLPVTYLGYFLAHEAHHRGQILVALRLSATHLPDDVKVDLWQRWSRAP